MVPYYLYPGVKIGKNVTIGPYAVIGKPPMVPKGTTTRVPSLDVKKTTIGDNCVIGAGAVIYHDVKIGNNTLIGDGAKVRDKTRIGNHCIIGMNSKIAYNAKIGNYVKIMDLCNIAGNIVIGDYVFISVGVLSCNDNSIGIGKIEGTEFTTGGPIIGPYARIGQGAILNPGVIIGNNSLVGAGSVVTRDVYPGYIFMGVPAKSVGMIPRDQWRGEGYDS